MKNLIRSLAIIAVMGCGQTHKKDSGITVPKDPTIVEILDEFMQEAAKRGIFPNRNYIHIETVEPNEDNKAYYGLCEGYANAQHITLVSDIPPAKLRLVLFHELGHCVLGIEHSEDAHDIMYHTMTWLPTERWDDAVNDLFESRDLRWTELTTENPSEDICDETNETPKVN